MDTMSINIIQRHVLHLQVEACGFEATVSSEHEDRVEGPRLQPEEAKLHLSAANAEEAEKARVTWQRVKQSTV